MRQLKHEIVKWPAKGEFRISRSSLSEFITVQVTITENGHTGRAECRPYSRYDETAQTVISAIEEVRSQIEQGISPEELQSIMPAGAARNAVDCALWDLRAKQNGAYIWELLDIRPPTPRITAYTLSMNTPEQMARAALKAKAYNLLKMKIGGPEGIEAVNAVIRSRPDAHLIVDANEALSLEALETLCSNDMAHKIALIEQPLPADQDRPGLFSDITTIPICADESLHTRRDLIRLKQAGYTAVNVKLDKTGGLTEAYSLMKEARLMGFKVMAGCMVGSSLAMAPMAYLESLADYIDLDGPLLLNKDVKNALTYDGEILHPPKQELWG